MNITLTLFNSNLDEILGTFLCHLKNDYQIQEVTVQNISLYNYYVQLYNSPIAEFILFAPQSNPSTTILYANIGDGYINLVKNISTMANLDFYHIVIANNLPNTMKSYQFHYFSPSYNRHILCYKDPKWIFYEEGLPLPFENVSLYTQKLKKNRLNQKIILSYLGILGWDIDNMDFWSTKKSFFIFKKI